MSLLTLFSNTFVPASVTPYLNLITSQHRIRPNFVASITALVQGFADTTAVALNIPSLLDLDVAIGDQLDKGGSWIGQTRNLDPTTGAQAGTTILHDGYYAPLLHGLAVLNNGWDGSVSYAYKAYAAWFKAQGGLGVIQDNGNLTITLGQAGFVADPVTKALFINGYMQARPAGVTVKQYVTATAAAPLFGFGGDGTGMAGLGHGCWGTFTPTS